MYIVLNFFFFKPLCFVYCILGIAVYEAPELGYENEIRIAIIYTL